jgi:hypothetical protein
MILRDQLRLLLSDRHTAESKALFLEVLRYVDCRTKTLGRRSWPDLLSGAELEEVAADVVLQLMSGSLAQFRGETLPELIGFVRTITDRCVWHRARRKIRERNALEGQEAETVRRWVASLAAPEDTALMTTDVSLSDDDQAYLRQLLEAGSKVEYARRHGVSRAAVTQRVKRITRRISQLTPLERQAVHAWLHHEARETIEHVPGVTALRMGLVTQ